MYWIWNKADIFEMLGMAGVIVTGIILCAAAYGVITVIDIVRKAKGLPELDLLVPEDQKEAETKES